MQPSLIRALTLALVLPGALGCASASSAAARAPRFAFSELSRHPEALKLIAERPVVLTFEAGEHIPVRFTLKSSVMATAAQPETFEILASKKFYLLVDPKKHGFRISTDGKDFDHGPKNGFRFGFNVTPELAQVDIGVALRRE